MERVRMSIEVTTKSRARIENIMELTEAASMTEAIRRALALCETVAAAIDAGGVVVIRDAIGNERQLELI